MYYIKAIYDCLSRITLCWYEKDVCINVDSLIAREINGFDSQSDHTTENYYCHSGCELGKFFNCSNTIALMWYYVPVI